MNVRTIIVILLLAAVQVHAVEIKVISNELPHETPHQVDINTLRIAINFNTKYVYPSHHSTFSLYSTLYPDLLFLWAGTL